MRRSTHELVEALRLGNLASLSTGVAVQKLGYSGNERVVSNSGFRNRLSRWGSIVMVETVTAFKKFENGAVGAVETNTVIFAGILCNTEMFSGRSHG